MDSRTFGEEDGRVPRRPKTSPIKETSVTKVNIPVNGGLFVMDAEKSNGEGAIYGAKLGGINAEETVFSNGGSVNITSNNFVPVMGNLSTREDLAHVVKNMNLIGKEALGRNKKVFKETIGNHGQK